MVIHLFNQLQSSCTLYAFGYEDCLQSLNICHWQMAHNQQECIFDATALLKAVPFALLVTNKHFGSRNLQL